MAEKSLAETPRAGPTCQPPPSPEELASAIAGVLAEREKEATYHWARQKMGKNRDAYMEQALRNFYALFLPLYAAKYPELRAANKKPSEAIREIAWSVPYDIPLNLKKRKGIPPNVHEILRDYENVLDIVKHRQSLKAPAKDKALALTGALPGIEYKEAYNWLYRPRKTASEIACLYIAQKYDLASGATVKKLLSFARQPMKLARRMVQDVASAAGVKISSSPPKTPKS